MAKKKQGKQLPLIDVQPENVVDIIKAAEVYKGHQTDRLNAQRDEKKAKDKVLSLVEAAGLQPLKDGVIRFEHDGFVFSVTPRDALIDIKKKE